MKKALMIPVYVAAFLWGGIQAAVALALSLGAIALTATLLVTAYSIPFLVIAWIIDAIVKAFGAH